MVFVVDDGVDWCVVNDVQVFVEVFVLFVEGYKFFVVYFFGLV